MTPSPLEVVREIYEARAAGQRIKMLALCSESMAFSFNVDPDKVGNGATYIGWAAINAHLDRVRMHWEELESKVIGLSIDRRNQSKVNVRVHVKLRHRLSEECFDGVKRQEWIVREGIATSMVEKLDRNLIQAIQRMAIVKRPPESEQVSGDG